MSSPRLSFSGTDANLAECSPLMRTLSREKVRNVLEQKELKRCSSLEWDLFKESLNSFKDLFKMTANFDMSGDRPAITWVFGDPPSLDEVDQQVNSQMIEKRVCDYYSVFSRYYGECDIESIQIKGSVTPWHPLFRGCAQSKELSDLKGCITMLEFDGTDFSADDFAFSEEWKNLSALSLNSCLHLNDLPKNMTNKSIKYIFLSDNNLQVEKPLTLFSSLTHLFPNLEYMHFNVVRPLHIPGITWFNQDSCPCCVKETERLAFRYLSMTKEEGEWTIHPLSYCLKEIDGKTFYYHTSCRSFFSRERLVAYIVEHDKEHNLKNASDPLLHSDHVLCPVCEKSGEKHPLSEGMQIPQLTIEKIYRKTWQELLSMVVPSGEHQQGARL